MITIFDEINPFIGLSKIEEHTKSDEKEADLYLSMEEQKSISIGRLFDNGVILDEITVSRKHAVIEMNKKNRFVIKDRDSKYGTLVYERGGEIKLGKEMKALQIGNIALGFKVRKG